MTKNVTKNELYLPSTDGKNRLHLIEWLPEGEPLAVVQIAHGMIEYIDRYDRFARVLAEHGCLVVGNDHLGHGLTAACADDLGYICPHDPSATVTADLHTIRRRYQDAHPDLPYFMLGHSMGSFLVRRYLMTHGEGLSGAILVGTGRMSPLVLSAARPLTKLMAAIKSERYHSPLLRKLSIDVYNSKFKPTRTPNDWISRCDESVDRYNADPLCTFSFTVNGFYLLIDTLRFIQSAANIRRLPLDLPLLFVSGAEDPVGESGEGVRRIAESYKRVGVKRIRVCLYPQDRHEVLAEPDCEQVFADILDWLDAAVKGDSTTPPGVVSPL